MRASSAIRPAGKPFPELCTSQPKTTLPSATTGEDSISVGSRARSPWLSECFQSTWPSDARSAYIVFPDGTKTVRTPRTSVTAADATIWPLYTSGCGLVSNVHRGVPSSARSAYTRPDQSPTYSVPSTSAGVAVTTSRVLKNQRSRSFDAVVGVTALGQVVANVRAGA